MINEYGAINGMRIGRGKRSVRRKLPKYHYVHHRSVKEHKNVSKLVDV
jgi:hypothetical protein